MSISYNVFVAYEYGNQKRYYFRRSKPDDWKTDRSPQNRIGRVWRNSKRSFGWCDYPGPLGNKQRRGKTTTLDAAVQTVIRKWNRRF